MIPIVSMGSFDLKIALPATKISAPFSDNIAELSKKLEEAI